MDTKEKKRMWFCSDYGIENKYIIKRLNENEEEVFIATHEKEVKGDDLNYLQKRRISKCSEKDFIIYGVGITGKEPKTNIVTLKCDENESALEQVSKIIGIRINLDEQFISAYAKNGIEGIKSIAGMLRMDNNVVENIAENIIIRDEHAKGITLKEQAEMAQRVNSLNNKKQTDYETIIAIDELFIQIEKLNLLETKKSKYVISKKELYIINNLFRGY